MDRPSRAAQPIDTDAILAELLTDCRQAAARCLRIQEISYSSRDWLVTGARLAKASLDIIAAMNKSNGEFTQRIVVERPGQQPQTAPGSPHNDNDSNSDGVRREGEGEGGKNSAKTIHRGADPSGYNIE